MRTTLAMVALAALLAACGDEDDYDGGGGTSVTLSGGSTSGTLTNGAAIRLSGSCDPADVGTFAVAVAFVAVSTHADLCAAASAGRDLANATTLELGIFKVATTATSTSLDAGTYVTFAGSSVPLPDAQGNVRAAVIRAVATGGAASPPATGCVENADGVATTGTVTVTAVTADSISGSVSATLDNGTTVSGTFTAPTCGVTATLGPSCEPTGLPDDDTCG
jgi:hypothetical protein